MKRSTLQAAMHKQQIRPYKAFGVRAYASSLMEALIECMASEDPNRNPRKVRNRKVHQFES